VKRLPTHSTTADHVRYLLSEGTFDKIDIFEQRSRVGGVWNLSAPEHSKKIPIPQTDPRYGSLPQDASPGKTIRTDGEVGTKDSLEFESPLYDYLETNIPKQLMAYSDQPFDPELPLFPGHDAVLDYLERHADDVRHLIQFHTQVINVTPGTVQWSVTARDILSGQETTLTYDAVVIANGHYTVPYVPDVPGVNTWNQANPGVIIHSKAYRRPEDFKGKKVIVIGNSASGSEIASQIGQHCKYPLLLSSRTYNELFAQPKWDLQRDVPEIVEFLLPVDHERAVKFKDGSIESNIDAVIFATGYFYSFPFLDLPSPIITDGFRTHDVYQHVFHIEYPTLAFPVLNLKVIPFPLAENQAAVMARVWSGRLSLPPKEKMRDWERKRLEERGDGKTFHVLKHPEDAQVLNTLYSWAKSAPRVSGLENGGQGKLGTYWDEKQVWMRSKFPDIKRAFAKRDKDRFNVKTLEELGFEYEKRNEGC
jgi:cation diffusion facilitator CzcD-associated flavoprotein CzcO